MDGNIIFLVLLAIIYLFQYLAGKGKPKPGQPGQTDPIGTPVRREYEEQLEGGREEHSPEIRDAIDEIGRILRGDPEPAAPPSRGPSSSTPPPARSTSSTAPPPYRSTSSTAPPRSVPPETQTRRAPEAPRSTQPSRPKEKPRHERRSSGPSLPEPHWTQQAPPSRTTSTPTRDTGAPPRSDKPLVSAHTPRTSLPTRPLKVRKPKEIEAVQTREVKRLLVDQQSARDAIVAAELLGPPVSRRKGRHGGR